MADYYDKLTGEPIGFSTGDSSNNLCPEAAAVYDELPMKDMIASTMCEERQAFYKPASEKEKFFDEKMTEVEDWDEDGPWRGMWSPFGTIAMGPDGKPSSEDFLEGFIRSFADGLR